MDLFSFTTIILVLFITIGFYLVFTDQLEGRSKTVITVALLISIFYIFINLNLFKSYTESKSSPTDASIIQTSTNVNTTSRSYSLSTWIYINDWNPGSPKNIFSMSGDNTPKIKLDENINKLIITYYTSPSLTGGSYTEETFEIPEISIQKWVNIVICFGDNKVDTYINGKLVKTHVSNGAVQYATSSSKSTTLSWGGFTGYISSSRYYPKFLTPQDVWNIYKGGFSSSLLGNYLNQYNVAFTFYQNQNETAKFYLM